MRLLLILAALSPLLSAQDDQPDFSKLSGKEIYDQFCSRCHAADGSGEIDKEMIDGMEAPPPDFRDGYFSSKEKRTDWETVISHGGGVRGLSMSMPAWGEVISPRQVTEVVEYVKSFVDQSRFPQGESNFLRAHTVTKAFVEQEFLIIPTRTTTSGSDKNEFVLNYADRFGDRFQYEAKLPATYINSPTTTAAGLGDLELGVKYCIYDDYRSKKILSAGVETSLPTGNTTLGLSSNYIVTTLYVAAGSALTQYSEVQVSFKAEQGMKSFSQSTLIGAAALTFIPFSSRQGLFPGIECVATRHPSGGTTVTIVPRLYIGISKLGHVAMSFGPEIYQSGPKPFDSRWRAFFLWDYADGGLWW